MVVEIEGDWTEDTFAVAYHRSSYSFDVTPKPDGGITSVLIDDLQLEVDDEGLVLYAWGLFPTPEQCTPTSDSPPPANKKRIRFLRNEGWTPGVSVRINKQPWDVFVNSDGWMGAGQSATPENATAIEFASRSIAIIENNSIVAIWLKPVVAA